MSAATTLPRGYADLVHEVTWKVSLSKVVSQTLGPDSCLSNVQGAARTNSAAIWNKLLVLKIVNAYRSHNTQRNASNYSPLLALPTLT